METVANRLCNKVVIAAALLSFFSFVNAVAESSYQNDQLKKSEKVDFGALEWDVPCAPMTSTMEVKRPGAF